MLLSVVLFGERGVTKNDEIILKYADENFIHIGRDDRGTGKSYTADITEQYSNNKPFPISVS